MKWVITAALVYCAVASAQVLHPDSAAKLQPYQLKALENGLGIAKGTATNNSLGPLIKLPPLNAAAVLSPRASVQIAVEGACAIPLLKAHVNSAIDAGIQRKLDAKAFSADNMPVAKGLPVCQRVGDLSR